MTEDLLQNLVEHPGESLNVELKPWLDPNDNFGIAKIAKACLAFRNNDGGHLVLGFNDDGTLAENIPEDIKNYYTSDRFQEIISKYASEPFAVSLEWREANKQLHPIVTVPPGVITPVFAKSTLDDPRDGQRALIEDDAIYVRSLTSNNRVSSSKLRRGDIGRLMKSCFDNREADIGAFIRRHLPNLSTHILQASLDNPQSDSITPTAVLESGFKRFQETASEASEKLPESGYWQAAAVINGFQSNYEATRELLYRLQRTRQNHSGWPPWTVIDNPERKSMNPRVVGDQWEALMISTDFTPAIIDYWQVNPSGLFYYVRALEDDMQIESQQPKPGTILDFYLVVYRVTETISAVLQFAAELGANSQNTIQFAFKWTNLKGRVLGCWSDSRRLVHQNLTAYDDEVISKIDIPSDVPTSTIPSFVCKVVKKLFLVFEGCEIPEKTIENISNEVLKHRM